MITAPEKIKVSYKYVDDMHFVAADKLAAGLCVRHEDLGVAYAEVGEQLKALFKFNYGKKQKFHPVVPLAGI